MCWKYMPRRGVQNRSGDDYTTKHVDSIIILNCSYSWQG
ncbi:hypothetical protein DCCM_2689 [Desulfocucumis palustris]|uniref:Uncharacterized protein n=1 Tax=Desulfocucumis palustris TaxID=1898651 RepID=A0A2L2XCY3_9FIRM|nr:hypothetical protein DCCM_2689 [Desulfocucumis palustris]